MATAARPGCVGLPPADLPAGGLHPALVDPWEAALAKAAGKAPAGGE